MRYILFLIATLLISSQSFACPDHEAHTHTDTSTKVSATKSDKAHSLPNSKAHDYFKNDMESMHHNMVIEPSGNIDVDFMRGMIPHHEGAVAMAKTALEHSKDPIVRKLAEDIISSQNDEIKLMKEWLKKNDK
jgi:uncharacterized protein (DUF305 family)